jgi:NitT/TauT family transport system substrate-binding protein
VKLQEPQVRPLRTADWDALVFPSSNRPKFEFIINLKAAKQIGLAISSGVLGRADKMLRLLTPLKSQMPNQLDSGQRLVPRRTKAVYAGFRFRFPRFGFRFCHRFEGGFMKGVTLAVSVSFVLCFCGVAPAQLTKLTIGNNTLSAAGLPAWMAKESGIFRKNGLEVQIVYFRGGTITTMALIARETPISQVSGPPMVSAALKGADAVMIAGGNVVAEYWLISRPDIKTAEQLKGGSVAIATFGGLSDGMARIAVQKLGLNPVKDITLVQIGTIPERLSALDTGKVQAAMLNAPDNFRAQKRGLYKLMGVRLPYQGIGVGTTRAFIRENPDVARRYIRSQVEAVHHLKTDREAGTKVLAKYLALQDKEILQKAYDDGVNDEILPTKQYPTLEGIKKILEPLGETDPKAKAAKPEDFVDMRFIRELDESGVTNDLYKGDTK